MKYLKNSIIFIKYDIENNKTMDSKPKMTTTDTFCKEEPNYEMFPFNLSNWQKLALETIHKGDHCLVTAPTGSGKTLPAEYAIKYFTHLKKKVIYTSPLKALSNQKYNDFKNQFPDISFGILTGDIKDNETADVLIMTTEILCNYLHNYKKTANERKNLDFNIDLEQELGCVIFDEVHYINDADRGTVWEESIMLMPNCVQMVMLSATIDEPERFAQWVNSTNLTKTTVICSTNQRAVPLKHYLWYGVSEKMITKRVKNKDMIHLINKRGNKLNVLCEKGVFNDKVYHDIYKIKDDLDYNQIYLKRNYLLNQLIRFLDTNNMLPGICFVYSRKLVESFAKEITVNLLDNQMSNRVESECRKILNKLNNYQEYNKLPEYNMVIRLLQKGIGIHHAGLVPILREMVEIMFGKGYVKVLFATETFAVGLNMPTKTVVFTNLRKYCCYGERYLYSHEYTQQAGRAGRRGYDDVGHVIHLTNLFEMPEIVDYRFIMSNKPQSIYSKFKISYSLLLNMNHSFDSLENVIKFVKNSIVQSDISKELRGIDIDLQTADKNIAKNESLVKSVCMLTQEKYDKINNLENEISWGMYKNKALRAKKLELQDLKSESKHIERDYNIFKELEVALKKKKQTLERKDNCENYISRNINQVHKALLEHGFEGKKALVASQIKETHCLVMSDLLDYYFLFDDFTEEEIIGVLSCFTTMNVSSEMRSFVPSSKNHKVCQAIEFVQKQMEFYENYETTNNFYTGSDYNINFNVCDIFMKWCNIDDADKAEVFFKEVREYKQVFVGEFVKGVLKIVNILKEHEKIYSTIDENLVYIEKIKKCYDLLLKFVCTSQSLYV